MAGRKMSKVSSLISFGRSPVTPLSPRHPDIADNNEDRICDNDDPEASNEDGPETNTFFQSTLSSLEMSTLYSKDEVSDLLPLPLLLRQEYDHISALIEKEPRNNQGSVVVRGQPGTAEVLVYVFAWLSRVIVFISLPSYCCSGRILLSPLRLFRPPSVWPH